MQNKGLIATCLVVIAITGLSALRAPREAGAAAKAAPAPATSGGIKKIVKTESEWKKVLTPDQIGRAHV